MKQEVVTVGLDLSYHYRGCRADQAELKKRMLVTGDVTPVSSSIWN